MSENKIKQITIFQLMGIIFAIVFEFLGFLLFFGVLGYFLQLYFIDHPLVMVISIFAGLMIGIYYMYRRANVLSSVQIKKEKSSIDSIVFKNEELTKNRIEQLKKEIKEQDNKMQKFFNSKKK